MERRSLFQTAIVFLILRIGDACTTVGLQRYRKVHLLPSVFIGNLALIDDYRITGIGQDGRLKTVLATYPNIFVDTQVDKDSERKYRSIFQFKNTCFTALEEKRGGIPELKIILPYYSNRENKFILLDFISINIKDVAENSFHMNTKSVIVPCDRNNRKMIFLDEDGKMCIYDQKQVVTVHTSEILAISHHDGCYFWMTKDRLISFKDNFEEPARIEFILESFNVSEVHSIVFNPEGDVFVCHNDGIIFHEMRRRYDFSVLEDFDSCRSMLFLERDLFIDTGEDFSKYELIEGSVLTTIKEKGVLVPIMKEGPKKEFIWEELEKAWERPIIKLKFVFFASFLVAVYAIRYMKNHNYFQKTTLVNV